MGQHLLLTLHLHGSGEGAIRYHGIAQGAPEWPPSPARVFQALVAGVARGGALPGECVRALEWLERLPLPVIAAPRVRRGMPFTLFVPNNDADAVEDPRDSSNIRVRKLVHPSLLADESPFLYAWSIPEPAPEATVIVEAANTLYQLGRGVDMAWAVGEVVDDETLAESLRRHDGSVFRPEEGAVGMGLACPVSGSLASLVRRHQATKLRVDGVGRAARTLFSNPPKPCFSAVTYQPQRTRVVYELRDRTRDDRMWPWSLHRIVKLIESVRDGGAARLRDGLPEASSVIERALIGRKADGSNAIPPEDRIRLIPLPSIGYHYADRAVRRIVLDVPSRCGLRTVDVEWAFSGLEVGGFVLTRTDDDDMLRRFIGPSRHWRSVTAVALPQFASRRRIDPTRRREQAKGAHERMDEEARARGAIGTTLRHAGIRANLIDVRVQREPFESKGARAETFADGTRFAKERLWHVDALFAEPIEGPLILGDGRFLGLGVMAPAARSDLATGSASLGLHVFAVDDGLAENADAATIARALRRAVMARVQERLGSGKRLPAFFSGHAADGSPAHSDESPHLAFVHDPPRRRVLVVAPHAIEGRRPIGNERNDLRILDDALREFRTLRAGPAGVLNLRRTFIDRLTDPLFAPSKTWRGVTPYVVNRHIRAGTAQEALAQDLEAECRRRSLPDARIIVNDCRGVEGIGLQGHATLQFKVAVAGILLLGRQRYFGSGLFEGVA